LGQQQTRRPPLQKLPSLESIRIHGFPLHAGWVGRPGEVPVLVIVTFLFSLFLEAAIASTLVNPSVCDYPVLGFKISSAN
jgi:hypothetical protein